MRSVAGGEDVSGICSAERLLKLPFSVPLSVGGSVSFLKKAISERTISLRIECDEFAFDIAVMVLKSENG